MAKGLNYLGVDVGASGIKVVEVTGHGGRAKLLTYGYSDRKPRKIEDPLGNISLRGAELREVCKRAGVKSKTAVTGLPVSEVFSTIFSFARMSDKELALRIKDKIIKISPIEESDLVLDWKKIEGGSEDKLIRVSATAASKKTINKYVEIFKVAGFTLSNLETEAFAMSRSLLGKDKALSLIVDIGSLKTNILVVKKGVPVIHRSVKVGGESITATLGGRLGLSIEKAEKAKRDLAISEKGLSKEILSDFITPIINEVRYTEEMYEKQYNNDKIEKIILTGGGANISKISKLLSEATGLRTFLGDPWARIMYPEDLRSALDELGPRFSVAVGLALRDLL